ncbi:MAG: pirin family protein [Oligoflexia bacterium]|nr:pirin family protein [Oligoflexia bacterium]
MLQIRHSSERGFADHGWLKSWHTFSFADYYDPKQMGFRVLRVINEDRIAPGKGFDTHPHNNMEIISFVVSGQLAHRDSMGNTHIVGAGEFQAMSAGSGVTHSEFNPSQSSETHLLQIWIQPSKRGITPRYAEWKTNQKTTGPLTLIASADGRSASLIIEQDASVYLGKLASGKDAEFTPAPGRYAWIQLVSGRLNLLGQTLHAGDGASLSAEPQLELRAESDCVFLLFDLP